MPLSTIARVSFDADIAHTRDEFKRPVASLRRKRADPPPEELAEPDGFHVVSEGAASTVGLSILAQALVAYSEN